VTLFAASQVNHNQRWRASGLMAPPFKRKDAPALKPGRLFLYTACPQKNCLGSTSLLIFWFLLTWVLRIAALRRILLGDVLWTVALIFR
jgi:hypothetical protein